MEVDQVIATSAATNTWRRKLTPSNDEILKEIVGMIDEREEFYEPIFPDESGVIEKEFMGVMGKVSGRDNEGSMTVQYLFNSSSRPWKRP